MGERIESRMKLYKPGPGGHFILLDWPHEFPWPAFGEPDYVEGHCGRSNGRPLLPWPERGSSGHGQVKLVSDVSMLYWFVVIAEPGKSYRFYVNGKLYRQVLAPGGVPKETEKAVTTVSSAQYNIPLYGLRWP
jgi:hypothetical protein